MKTPTKRPEPDRNTIIQNVQTNTLGGINNV